MGFFVSRHLGLVGCNIGLMKRFLPLLILTGLLFGQDVLLLKSGKNYKGRYITKENDVIIFRLEGEKNISMFSINDVDIIMRSDGDLYYPFDTSTKKDSPSFGQDGLILKSGKVYNGTFIGKVDKLIVFQVEGKNDLTKFPVNDVAIIKTSEGELTYPFKNPTKVFKYSSEGWSQSSSYGFLSEKIPISFMDLSLLYNIDEHSELYGTLTYYLFGGGFGLGYKYYTAGKSKSSMFVSTCAHTLLLGEFSPEIYGFSTAVGVSRRKIGGKTSINIGISLLYLSSKSYSRGQENEFGILPFINLERRR